MPSVPVTLHLVHNLDGNVIAEYEAPTTLLAEYIWLDDRPVGMIADAGTLSPKLYFVHTDQVERPVMMTDASAAVVWRTSPPCAFAPGVRRSKSPFGGLRPLRGSRLTPSVRQPRSPASPRLTTASPASGSSSNPASPTTGTATTTLPPAAISSQIHSAWRMDRADGRMSTTTRLCTRILRVYGSFLRKMGSRSRLIQDQKWGGQ